MREGWKYKKLKDVASLITDGDWIESRHQSESGIRLIQTGNVGNGIFKAKDDKPHYISEDTFLELGCTEIFRGDCLVSRLPEPVGRACIIPEVGCRMITAVDCTIIRFKDCVLPKLFVYYTRSKQYKREIDNSTTGTTRKRISRKNLESVSIPLLPVDEQNKIVAELDLLTEIIDKQKQQLKELDTLAQSIFYDMFGNPDTNSKGWLVKKLGELCKSDLGKTLNASKDTGKMRPYLCAINIHWNEIDLSTLKQTKFEDEELERYSVVKGDLLVCEGGDVGRSAIWKEDKVIQYQNALHRIRFGKEIIAIYCLFVLQYLKVNGILDGRYGKGVTIKHLVKSSLLSIPIPVPPIEFQREFADKIQSIEAQKESINRSIAESQKLFDYTMDKYFG